MEIQQLKYFKTVAETGKISDAAYKLFISPPALSTAIQRLEKDIGCQLFHRTKNRIVLNQQGEILLKHINCILDEMDYAKEEIKESLSADASTISLLGTNALMWSGLIAEFSAANPDITVLFTMVPISALTQHKLTHQYSFLLAADSDIPDAAHDALDSVYLFENTPMVMISPKHPLSKESIIDLSMLKTENIIMTTPDHTMYREIERMFSAYNIPVPTNSLASNEIRQHLVEKNLGISFASKYGSAFMPQTLRYIPIRNATPLITKLYWYKNRKLNKSEESFKAFATKFFSESPSFEHNMNITLD